MLRLLTLVSLLALSVTIAQPAVAAATTALPPDRLQQPANQGGQPGAIVRQAFDYLMDYFVVPPNSGDALNGGLDGAHNYLESKQVEDPLAERPPFTGDRREDWRLFVTAYQRMLSALGDKGPRQELDRAVVDGMARSFKEGHTYYMTPDEWRQAQDELQNRRGFVGIGVVIQNGVITEVFEGSPAAEGGIQVQDRLVAVNGESVEGLSPGEVSAKIRGEAGTPVTLTIRREGEPNPIEKVLTRAQISVQWVRSKILDGGIGYLQISIFATTDALPIFHRELQKLIDANITALVVDLRNNGGGVVPTAEEIASRLIPNGRPLYHVTERRNGERIVKTWGDYWNRDIPIAVLTNELSASGSEILASALQENGLARVFGTRTAGVLAGAAPFTLADGSGLLVTVQTITTAQGRVINEIGLEPDEVVPLDIEQLRQGKDNQLEAALSYVREQVNQRTRPARASEPSASVRGS